MNDFDSIVSFLIPVMLNSFDKIPMTTLIDPYKTIVAKFDGELFLLLE